MAYERIGPPVSDNSAKTDQLVGRRNNVPPILPSRRRPTSPQDPGDGGAAAACGAELVPLRCVHLPGGLTFSLPENLGVGGGGAPAPLINSGALPI
ncbi:hypothetical protein E2562_017084 [Oryza meyeriana var. granulata]|uniref:Uncharacterized protein n=1 Tax=Oryza meyeriana var. granulata TaxID=110450 RepID=A0A6G1F8Y3_9ORYZ|nr:hypothetical protein E2562_017084 [Oryza meyeriana var. granulata]